MRGNLSLLLSVLPADDTDSMVILRYHGHAGILCR